MLEQQLSNPYPENLLIDGLGPIHSRAETMVALTELPAMLDNVASVPVHVRLRYLMMLRDFHLPSLEELRLHETVDLMIRSSYHYRNPLSAATWGLVGGEPARPKRPRAPASGAAVEGISGVGKTEACLRCLNTYPQQVISHPSFPKMEGGHQQVIWQSVDVPASGRAADLAANLMTAWGADTGSNRFGATLTKERRDGMKLLDEWRQVAISHFLGVLHLDEVQNFFKLSSLEQRRKRKGARDLPELSIVEDQCLKWILTLMNTWQIPILLSGTPDGIDALTRRLSNTERIVTSGYHPFRHFDSPADPQFQAGFLAYLGRYQFVEKKLPIDDTLATLIIEITGGIQRLIVALWIAAHRVAFERGGFDLRLEDFSVAANTYLAPVAPAVAALRSMDPTRMARYEDLLPRASMFWAQFWDSTGGK